MKIHEPVLLNEVFEYLNLGDPSAGSGQVDKKVIDATLDGGGHSNTILERFPDVKILGIEFDPELIREAELNQKIILINDSYLNIKKIAEENDFYPDGIIFDLGLSSWHYERSGRGFSFQKDELLDMRFNPEVQKTTAMEIINTYGEKELAEILKIYGEEKFAESIAKNVVKTRKEKPIMRTVELVEAINNSVPEWYKHKKINPATKTFQALRVTVNNEIENIEKGILAAIEILNREGRLIVISFQGLEDRKVKEIFKEKVKAGIIKFVTKKTIKPSWEERKRNPRARSAKMKIIEKI